MFCSRYRIAALFLLGICFGSCTKPPISWRVAVLRFENLRPGGDTDWIGRALSEAIAGQLEGTRHNAIVPFATLHQFDTALGARPVSAPGVSTERAAALAAGANRLLTGFYQVRGNRFTVTAEEEDVETRSATAPFTVSGTVDEILHLGASIAQNVDDEALPPITGSARALRSYALGLESTEPQAAALFEDAVRLDPDFGKPYVALAAQALANHNAEVFGQVFSCVRARGDGVRAVDRAVLNLEDAQLHAPVATQIDALAALVRLMPADPFRLQELGTAELEANRYAEAADHFRKLQTLLPSNAEPLNLQGYALMYNGDEPGALHAFELYWKSRPQDANALDSTGDALFFFRRFKEAEDNYLRAHEKDPGLADGADLLKAAWTRLMRNDRNGAAVLIGAYRNERRKRQDPLADLRCAPILRAMGNHEEAGRITDTYAHSGPVAIRPAAAAQLAWWQFLDGSAPAPDNRSDQAQALQTIARKDYQAALPFWRKLAEEAPPTDWWTRTVYARVLFQTGQTQEGARYLRYAPPPQPNRTLSFDELWYPWILSAHS